MSGVHLIKDVPGICGLSKTGFADNKAEPDGGGRESEPREMSEHRAREPQTSCAHRRSRSLGKLCTPSTVVR